MDDGVDEVRATRAWVGTLLTVVLGVLSVFSAISTYFLALNASGCVDAACGSTIQTAIVTGIAAIVVLTVAALVGEIVTRRAGRSGIVPPLVGIALVIGVVVVVNLIIDGAVSAG